MTLPTILFLSFVWGFIAVLISGVVVGDSPYLFSYEFINERNHIKRLIAVSLHGPLVLTIFLVVTLIIQLKKAYDRL